MSDAAIVLIENAHVRLASAPKDADRKRIIVDACKEVGRPIFFAMVIGLSFVVLMCVFRSIVIPLKAVLLEEGSLTSHMVIVARAMGVPATKKKNRLRKDRKRARIRAESFTAAAASSPTRSSNRRRRAN